MPILIVVNTPADWPLHIPGVEVVAARAYLTEARYSDLRNVKVFNLCKSYRYQSTGYYVSLLAAARGHKPIPNVVTIQDMKSLTIVRLASDELEELIHTSLAPIQSRKFILSIYFGRNVAKRYDRLCQHLFKMFEAPFLRAHFQKNGDGEWELQSVGPIALSDIPNAHRGFIVQVATEYFEGRRFSVPKRSMPRFDLAMLVGETDTHRPSNDKALKLFEEAAEELDFGVERITKEDYGRLAEFDALFIRETTSVNHHTYRFARRAAAEGLVVVDDPESILKCTNKVFLAELLDHHGIGIPKTLIVHRDNVDEIVPTLGLPVILKQPDSSFSQGVIKVSTAEELEVEVERFLDKSDLVIAQEFVPTEFDWRIGVFDRKALYACKYFMARKHWQILKKEDDGDTDYGKVETIPVGLVPKQVLTTAMRAANLIGDGLYGVDLKQVGRKSVVIEVNDNPSIDAGFEDRILREELYTRIMEVFLKRVERRRGERNDS